MSFAIPRRFRCLHVSAPCLALAAAACSPAIGTPEAAGFIESSNTPGIFFKPVALATHKSGVEPAFIMKRVPEVPLVDLKTTSTFYEEGEYEYLTLTVPNIQKFSGYAGYLITYYGDKDAAGGCSAAAKVTKKIGAASMVAAGKEAEVLPPNGKIAEILITRASGANAGIAVLFSGSVSDSASVDLLASEVAAERALAVLDPAKLASARSQPLPAGACAVKVVTSAALIQTIAKYYRGRAKEASATGFNIKIGGRWQNSTQSFSSDLVVRIETRDL